MQAQPDNVSLTKLPLGRIATITDIYNNDGVSSERLRELGFAEGMSIEVLQSGAVGNPMVVLVGSMRVALRQQYASQVEVSIS